MLIMEDASCQFTDAEFREQEASGTCPTEFMFAFELSWQDVHAQVESRGYGRRVMSMNDFSPRAIQWTNRERLRQMDIGPVMTQSAASMMTGGPNFRWMYHADFIRMTEAQAVLYTKDRDQYYPYMVYEFPAPLDVNQLGELLSKSLNLRLTVPREPTLIISNSAFYDNQSVHHLRHGNVDDAQPEDDDSDDVEINHVQDVLDSLSAEQLRDALNTRNSTSDFEYEPPPVPTARPKRRLLR